MVRTVTMKSKSSICTQTKTFIAFNEILASFPRLKYGFVFYRGQGRLHDCTNSYSWVLSFPKDLFYRTNFANTYDANSKVCCSCKLPWVCNLHTPCCHIFKMIDNQTESIQCVGNDSVKNNCLPNLSGCYQHNQIRDPSLVL